MRRREYLASGVALGNIVLAGCTDSGSGTVNLQVHTAAEGASHYNMSAPWVEMLPEHSEDPQLSATVSSSDGSVANMRMLGGGNTDIGTSVDQVAHLAQNGVGPFDEEIDLACIMRGEVVGQYYVVREDSDIESVADLDGRRVTAGPAGSGTLGQHQTLMEAFGVDTEDVNLSYAEGGRALRDGDVDAWWIFHGSQSRNAFSTAGDRLRVLGFSESEMGTIQDEFPWTANYELGPDMLEGHDRTVTVMGTNGFWITSPDFDDDAIYELCRVVTQNPEPIQDANINSREFGLEFAYYDFGVPYHDAATEYFEDEGVL